MTTTSITIGELTPLPSKKDIIQRLFNDGHISFDEMWLLILDEPDVKYVPMPYVEPYQPWVPPFNPNDYPWTITTTDGTNQAQFCNSRRGEDSTH